MLWKRGCVPGLQVCGLGLDLGLEGCGLVNITASIPSGSPHHSHNNTTTMQYETKTHKTHTDKHK